MKLILPVAGEGTRLRPHTYNLPKVLIPVAGKPMIGHIIDEVLSSIKIEEIIFIVGRFGEKIAEFIEKNYDIKAFYFKQVELLGLAHAVSLSKDRFKMGEPTFIIYGDTLFHANLKDAVRDIDGCIGVKEVEDPRRFGIVELESGFITRLEEKPDNPKTNLATVGVNYIKDTKHLFTAIEQIIRGGKRTKGEFQLTDAFQLMVEDGARLQPFLIDDWFDCGKPETLLNTNRILLEENGNYQEQINTIIIPPVYIHPKASVESSVIGPFVSISKNAHIVSSIITNSIIFEDAYVEGLVLDSSIIGKNVICKGTFKHLNVGDTSNVDL